MGKKSRNKLREHNGRAPEKDEKQILYGQLTQIPFVDKRVERALTPGFVKEYFELVASREIAETDWMYLTGELSAEQALQYAYLCGDFEKMKQKFNSLTTRMAAHFNKAAVLEMVNNDIKGDARKGIRNFFQQVTGLVDYMPKVLEGKGCAYAFFSMIFRQQLMAHVGRTLVEIAQTSNDDKVRDFTTGFLNYADSIFIKHHGFQFPGILLHNELVFYENTVNKPDNQNDLDEMIQGRPIGPEEKEILEREAKTLLAEVRKEASYKKILFHRVRPGKPQVVLFGDDFMTEGARYSGFCAFRINFNGSRDIDCPKIRIDPVGNQILDFEEAADTVNCNLSPETGELSLIVNRDINLSAVLDENRYLLLKIYLLERLRDYLTSKEPDIDDLFAPSLQEQRKSFSEELEEAAAEPVPADATTAETATVPEKSAEAESEIPSAWQYRPYVKPQEEAVVLKVLAEEKPAELKSLPKGQRKMVIDKIWGATGAEAMGAIKRLLGEPVRQEGSHVSFRSDRTNATLPVPKKDCIPPPLIMANLKNWGYSLMEYARELGAKI